VVYYTEIGRTKGVTFVATDQLLMKRHLCLKRHYHLALLLAAATLVLPVSAQINFPMGSSFRYLKGNQTTMNVSELMGANLDVSGWATSNAPFRYGDGNGGTVLSDMQGSYTTVFLHTTFTAEQVEKLTTVDLGVNYDDGFVVAINGKTVLSVNAPSSLSKSSIALANHEWAVAESYTLNVADLNLVNGGNTLTVMLLNVSLNSSDFYFDMSLSASPPMPAFPHEANVLFSQKAGFYTSPFILTLTSPIEGCTLKYTIDGSDPGTSSTAVSVNTSSVNITINPSLNIGRGTTPAYVVRACLTKTGYKPSAALAHTYVFLDKVKSQAHPGAPWPGYNVNGQSLDYAMASDVVNNATYGPQLEKALKQIPTISVNTDMANLFSVATGIYVNAEKGGRAWERPCSIELIDANGVQQFQINAGLRIRGAASAKQKESAKRAFRFYFRDEYGAKKLEYPLFGTEGATTFDCIDLRCEQNYSWSKDGDAHNNFITDIYSRDMQGKMGQPYKRGRYYHLYLNGMYWGLYQTDERAEASYAETYFGGEKEDYDVIKVNSDGWPYFNEPTDGNMDAWTELWTKCVTGFASNSAYLALQGKHSNGSLNPMGKSLVDIDNLIDYMLVIFYTGNFDAPVSAWYGDDMPNNFYAVYNRNDYSKGFRFMAHDSEHSMFPDPVNINDGIQENRVNLGSKGLMNITSVSAFNPQWLHYKLSMNPEYTLRFKDRAYKHFSRGGLLTAQQAPLSYQSRQAEIDYAVIAESARWGDAKRSTSFTKQDWLKFLQSLYDRFFPARSDIVKQQLIDEGLFPNLATPLVKLNGGSVYAEYQRFYTNLTVTLTHPDNATSGALYYTLDDTDPRNFGGTINPTSTLVVGSASLAIDNTTVINARIFNSGNWGPLKRLLLSKATEDYANLKVTEIHYHPADTLIDSGVVGGEQYEFIEFKNIGSSPIDLTGLRLDSAVYHPFPDYTVLNPGGFYVAAFKPNRFYTRYKRYPTASFSKNFANSGETVVLTDRQNKKWLLFTYDDSDPWPTSADGNGYTLTACETNPTGDPNDPSYWMASSSKNGSPFADDQNALVALNDLPAASTLVKLYPNPTDGAFFINTATNEPYTIQVYDLQGRLVVQADGSTSSVVDLSKGALPYGLYLVKLQWATHSERHKVVYTR
jgi:hypothetical protein